MPSYFLRCLENLLIFCHAMILAPEGSFIHDVSICTTLPLPLILMLYRGIFQYQNAGFVQNNIDREEDTDILLIN